MEFIDHTGHVFSLPSYSKKPIGYEYNTNDYIFWMNSEYTGKLSVDCFYMLPIRPLLDGTKNIIDVQIEIDSNIYSLVGSRQIQELVKNNTRLNEYIRLNYENDIKSKLTLTDDLIYVQGLNEGSDIYDFVPFYICGIAKEEGTWISNTLIHILYEPEIPDENEYDEEWCAITIGGEFFDEIEPLIINEKNMGIDLPKDILRAVYQYGFYNDEPDETLFAQKVKEYLLSMMHIKGECGNFRSAIDSLKWFGWGGKLQITKLLQTDNQFLDQYIHDYFDITVDLLQSYQTFRNSTYISLIVPDNYVTDKEDIPDFTKDFYGEAKPFTEDLFNTLVQEHYDEGDITFYRSYYDYCFDELGLKLACLAYYYKKYFLPIHLSIHSASIRHQVFINDTKHIVGASVKISEKPKLTSCEWTKVKFAGTGYHYIYNQKFFLDYSYNVMTQYEELGRYTDFESLYINDVCVSVPIYFFSKYKEQFYDCHLILLRDGKQIYESSFQFVQNEENQYKSFVIIPKQLNQNKDINYWLEKPYRLALLCNGTWYYYDFIIKLPEFQINFGSLKYKYYDTDNFTPIDISKEENYDGRWGDVDNESGIPDVNIRNYIGEQRSFHQQIAKIYKSTETSTKGWTVYKNNQDMTVNPNASFVDFNSFMYVPHLTEIHDINFYDNLTQRVDYINKVLTHDEFCKYLASKVYIYGANLNSTKDKYVVGNEVVPQFFFNNGIDGLDKETSVDGVKWGLRDFKVECFFDIVDDGSYYAKRTFEFDELKKKSEQVGGKYVAIEVKGDKFEFDKRIKYNYSLLREEQIKKNITHTPALVQDMKGGEPWFLYEDERDENGNLVYKKDPNGNPIKVYVDDWYKFYIDEVLKTNLIQTNRNMFTIRLVTTGVIEDGSEQGYEFGGYDENGKPRIYTDINITIHINDDEDDGNYCDLDGVMPDNLHPEDKGDASEFVCKGTCKIKCPFRRKDKNPTDDSSVTVIHKEDLANPNEDHPIMSDLVMDSINNLLKKHTQDAVIVNNENYLNRIHIYNIYFTKSANEILPYALNDAINLQKNTIIYDENGNKYKFISFSTDDIIDMNDYSVECISTNIADKTVHKIKPYYKILGEPATRKLWKYDHRLDTKLIGNVTYMERDLVEIYSRFFNDDGSEKLHFPTETYFDYDTYLMHDDDNWYVVFISRLPIAYKTYNTDLLCPDEIEYEDGLGNTWKLKHYRSGNRFLINRMYYVPSKGINHFNSNEIIVSTIDNVDFPYIFDKGTKWHIEPMSLGMNTSATVESATNAAIISLGNGNKKYENGYYNIKVRYSVDGNIQHQYIKTTRILVQ